VSESELIILLELPHAKNVDGIEYTEIKNETLLKRGIEKDKYMRKYFPNEGV